MFTDEATFTVRPSKHYVRVWRKVGQRYIQQCLIPTFKSGRKTVSVWGGFSVRGRTPLIRIHGNFNQSTYRNIIDSTILPFMEEKHGGLSEFILQEDNCGPQRAISISTYLSSKCIDRMIWPPQSLDIAPIENAWGFFEATFTEAFTVSEKRGPSFLCSMR